MRRRDIRRPDQLPSRPAATSPSWSSSATSPMRRAHLAARAAIERDFDRDRRRLPFGPFLAAGELLYQGPWVAERLAEFGDFLADQPGLGAPGDPDDPRRRREVLRRRTSSPPNTAWASSGPRSPGCGRRWTCWCCPPSARPSPSTRCSRTRSPPTPRSATTRTSATCWTSARRSSRRA